MPYTQPYTGPTFVNPTTMTLDNLLTSFPAGSAYRGQYARVADYAGEVDRVLRCDYFSATGVYAWTPTQAEYGKSLALTGDLTLAPLYSPTSVALTGSIAAGVTRTVNMVATNGRPGMVLELRNNLTSMLGTLNLIGTGIGSAVAFALGGYRKFFLDYSTGSGQWVQLV